MVSVNVVELRLFLVSRHIKENVWFLLSMVVSGLLMLILWLGFIRIGIRDRGSIEEVAVDRREYVIQWPELIFGLAVFAFLACIAIQLFGVLGGVGSLALGLYWVLRKPKG